MQWIVGGKMFSYKVVFAVVSLLFFDIAISESKTYYFNVNKTSNEYRVYNRVNINQTQEPGYQVAELRNIKTINKELTQAYTVYKHLYLDKDWNYDWSNSTRSRLPAYIYRLFETYSSSMKTMNGPTHILFNTLAKNVSVLRFNTSSVNKENLTDIELHFYYNVSKALYEKPLILRLFQMENDNFNETTLKNPDTHKLLNVIYISQADSGWQVFKLNNVIKNWFHLKNDLLLLITISEPKEDSFTAFKDVNMDVYRTFLILKAELLRNEIPIRASSGSNKQVDVYGSYCHKEHLFIDFGRHNWTNLIIAPQTVNLSVCNGKCFKVTDHLPNYLKLASLNAHFVRKALCCAPISHSDMPIMFYNANNDVVIKNYQNLIVNECGCR